MEEPLTWTGREVVDEFDDDGFTITTAVHREQASRSPAVSIPEESRWWVTGDIYGVETDEGYKPRTTSTAAEFCAQQFRERRFEFVSDLNGTFAAVCYQPGQERVVFITDRLGSHPIYYAPVEGGAVFATNIQALGFHPLVSNDVNVEALAEYCSLARSTGIPTPLSDVRNLQPSSITSVDFNGEEITRHQYWIPERKPVDRPFSEYAEQCVEVMEQVITERIEDDKRYGVLLSGGSDSRLVLDIMREHLDDDSLVTFHLSDWMSDEARIAEQLARSVGVEFQWLRRDDDYHARTLASVPEMMNFYGWFEQAHAADFAEQLHEEIDVLVTGLYADTWTRASFLPCHTLNLGPIGDWELPFGQATDSIETHLERYPDSTPPYLDTDRTIREILRSNVRQEDDGTIVDHGVTYPSLEELAMYGDVYPMWNDPDLFYWSVEQMEPHWTPFLDNRMIDLSLSLPLNYQLRQHLSNAALKMRDSPLAEVPNSTTGVSPRHGFQSQQTGKILTSFVRTFLRDTTPPEPYYTHRPWPDLSTMLRHKRFPGEQIHAAQDTVRSAPFMSWDGVLELLRAHVVGDARPQELYTLLTLLKMPIFDELADAEGQQQVVMMEADTPGPASEGRETGAERE